jgi:TolB-like protein
MTVHRFLDFELDTDLRELRRSDGVISVEPQVFDLLIYLIKHRDRLITRDELFENIWRGRIVSDATLSSRIKAARQAVGDTGKDQAIIQTLPRRGFRFVAAVEDAADRPTQARAPQSEPSHQDMELAHARKPSLAVLPFDNLSNNSEHAFFADGLVDDIINTLSKISKMRVIARHSTFTYKRTAADIRDIARELGVRYILEGTLRRIAERLRVTAQLYDTETVAQVWADRYDRHVHDVFDIQDEITKEIVTALRVQLTDGEEALAWSRGTNDVEAWQNLVKARELQDRLSATHLFESRRFAKRALELDPNYAYAWAILGFSYYREARLDFSGDREQRLNKVDRIATKALSLDNTATWAIGLSAMTATALGRHREGEEVVRRAIHLHPGNADLRGLAGFVFTFCGKFRDALEQARTAFSLNPFAPVWYHNVIIRAQALLGEHAEALMVIDEVLRVEPDNIPARVFQSYCFEATGRHEDARRAMKDLLRYVPHFRTEHVAGFLTLPTGSLTQHFTETLRSAGLPDADAYQ